MFGTLKSLTFVGKLVDHGIFYGRFDFSCTDNVSTIRCDGGSGCEKTSANDVDIKDKDKVCCLP